VLLLLQTKLLFDALYRAFLEFGAVHREDGLFAVQVHLEVRAFRRSESRAMLCQPSLEFFAVHGLNVNNIVYNVKGVYKQICLFFTVTGWLLVHVPYRNP
jgi:hypothetical protein